MLLRENISRIPKRKTENIENKSYSMLPENLNSSQLWIIKTRVARRPSEGNAGVARTCTGVHIPYGGS